MGRELTCEQLVEGHLDALHGYALGRTRNGDLAKEVVQRTFLKAFEKRGQLREPAAARAWLMAILRNEIAMEHRAHARFVVWEPDDFDAVPHPEESAAVDPELLAALPAALEGLSEGARDILVLRYQQDLSYDDIASLLGVPMGTVQSRIHRAKLTLKTLLQPAGLPARGGIA
jgi:RNA polymerase sigma-70 factor (ECF subfamily)